MRVFLRKVMIWVWLGGCGLFLGCFGVGVVCFLGFLVGVFWLGVFVLVPDHALRSQLQKSKSEFSGPRETVLE